MEGECNVCHKLEGKILRCSPCKSREYCSATCQSQDWPTHKASCKRRNYILKVDLHPCHITSPRIFRTISCPATASFADLHDALQIAFEWKQYDHYEFKVLDHNETMGSENKLVPQKTIVRILCPESRADSTLFNDKQVKASARTMLHHILDDATTKGKTIHYEYDVRDGWEHVIICSGHADPTTNFVVLGGEGHACVERVGGWRRWQSLLAAYETDRPTKEQKDVKDWFLNQGYQKDRTGFVYGEKYYWDKDRINPILQELSTSKARSARNNPSAKTVLMVSLGKESWFDDGYYDVLVKLRTKFVIKETTDIACAVALLRGSKEKYAAIIVTDARVMKPEFDGVNDELLEYASSGGTVIFGFLFGLEMQGSVEFSNFDPYFFRKWKKKWTLASYECDIAYSVNNQAYLFQRSQRTLKPYRMTAVNLQNAAPEDMVYVGARKGQSPALFGRFGPIKKGHVGFIGDSNREEGTIELLLAMCDV